MILIFQLLMMALHLNRVTCPHYIWDYLKSLFTFSQLGRSHQFYIFFKSDDITNLLIDSPIVTVFVSFLRNGFDVCSIFYLLKVLHLNIILMLIWFFIVLGISYKNRIPLFCFLDFFQHFYEETIKK